MAKPIDEVFRQFWWVGLLTSVGFFVAMSLARSAARKRILYRMLAVAAFAVLVLFVPSFLQSSSDPVSRIVPLAALSLLVWHSFRYSTVCDHCGAIVSSASQPRIRLTHCPKCGVPLSKVL